MVCLVDDEAVVRDALTGLLRSRRLLRTGFASADAVEVWGAEPGAPGRAAWPTSPACLVLDKRMPGACGLVLFERLIERALLPLMRVIFLTGHGDVPTAVVAVERGAFDFVEKRFSNNALVDRIGQALAASGMAVAERGRRREQARALAELTEREREVMARVIEGRPNKLIADALDIRVRTVEVHRARVFEKMNLKSAVDPANPLLEAGA